MEWNDVEKKAPKLDSSKNDAESFNAAREVVYNGSIVFAANEILEKFKSISDSSK